MFEFDSTRPSSSSYRLFNSVTTFHSHCCCSVSLFCSHGRVEKCGEQSVSHRLIEYELLTS